MALNLHSRRIGMGPPVVLLHGLFGAGGNLGALARSLQDRYTVYSLDLPGHGRSDWLAAYSLPEFALQLRNWLVRERLPPVHVVGHSLGGKVAMQLALESPALVQSLTVADIAPVTYGNRHDAVFAALQRVAAAECSSRDEAAQLMSLELSEEGVIAFLLSSLQRDAEGVYRWRMDVEGLRAGYDAMRTAPVQGSWAGPVMFVKGEQSDYLLPEHEAIIARLFPAAQFRIMHDCGHWLHVQKPALFNSIVARFLAAHTGVDGDA